MSTFIVLTGGPGGGKTALIQELARHPNWCGRFWVLPEAISVAGQIGISMRERHFQRLMVTVQRSLEDSLARAIDPDNHRLVLCHRGTLDPLAYWLDRGWSEDEFFSFIGTERQEHYGRYLVVLHLVTAADGAIEHYRYWPQAHRRERPEEAVRIDRLLQHAWEGHPNYHRLNNQDCDWPTKSQRALTILEQYL